MNSYICSYIYTKNVKTELPNYSADREICKKTYDAALIAAQRTNGGLWKNAGPWSIKVVGQYKC